MRRTTRRQGNCDRRRQRVSKDKSLNTQAEWIAVPKKTARDGRCLLRTNLYELLGDFKVGVITSDTLGCAFEPEQRFENPDGSDIIFDTDYFGAHRGIGALPGPFAEGFAVKRVL